ncbi:retinol dehydrogenase 16-like [Uloborus diversus]|uniref:retinol dehydrogenase 16-like n=1 Tax=Uloborus diversus TaxID=327109 RepID=UPI00240A5906|nr:retinol dehydrogenase 16-like [Uloborus diversus]
MFSLRYVAVVVHFALVGICLRTFCMFSPPCLISYYTVFSQVILFLMIANFTYEIWNHLYFTRRIKPKDKAVLITGCDSGFGQLLAKRLDHLGFTVFASCLEPSGKGATFLKENCSENLVAFNLDVRNDNSVTNAVKFIKKHLESSGKDLWAIVNNAGVISGFTSELSSMSDFIFCTEVNTLGPVRVTKAFLPLLRKSRGRVINLNSMAGRAALFIESPYSVSKYASVAFTECLRQELDMCGIEVISVEPEFFRTPMTNRDTIGNQIDKVYATLSEEIRTAYGIKYLNYAKLFATFIFGNSSGNVHVVIDALESAVCLKHPAAVYKPCRNIISKVIFYTIERIPNGLKYFCAKILFEVYMFFQTL